VQVSVVFRRRRHLLPMASRWERVFESAMVPERRTSEWGCPFAWTRASRY
jgi:hypothetical protein